MDPFVPMPAVIPTWPVFVRFRLALVLLFLVALIAAAWLAPAL